MITLAIHDVAFLDKFILGSYSHFVAVSDLHQYHGIKMLYKHNLQKAFPVLDTLI
jgi:hypothetical protein